MWRWDGEELEEEEVVTKQGGESEDETNNNGRTKTSRGHSSNRYVIPISDNFSPNHSLYEILIISPTLAALSPTTHLVEVLGNERRSLQEWTKRIHSHHGIVRSSHAHALRDAAQSL